MVQEGGISTRTHKVKQASVHLHQFDFKFLVISRSELGVNDEKTNKSPEFNPRDNDYFVDAKDTLSFLKEVIKRIGTNGTLSFPT